MGRLRKIPKKSMLKYVLDTVVLRVFAFAHPQGIDILLSALKTPSACFPTEVYNQDENNLPPNVSDESLSELARGLRYAQLKAQILPRLQGQRFQVRSRSVGDVRVVNGWVVVLGQKI